ncbi:TonB-dependent receptor [uncultured Flavobacterium sp.]|uniref:TonB-dependent receptor n=1 Tax=uncultured Flavobacterium sp. TaxID=165435 RepID=UPI0030CA5124
MKIYFMLLLFSVCAFSQTSITGKITTKNEILPFATVYLMELSKGITAKDNGQYLLENIPNGKYTLQFSYTGFRTIKKIITVFNQKEIILNCTLDEIYTLDEVVLTGTLKAVSRLESPVPVEVYTAVFLKKNPTSNIFEALQNVNGVRPQLNCNICNTGDIHINGLEGPYTMVTIDGMPIVSGLSTVYGLSGIPNSLIDRIEIVKDQLLLYMGVKLLGA